MITHILVNIVFNFVVETKKKTYTLHTYPKRYTLLLAHSSTSYNFEIIEPYSPTTLKSGEKEVLFMQSSGPPRPQK